MVTIETAMRITALLLGLVLPACGSGADGIAVPPPTDISAIERKPSNSALVTETLPGPAAALYEQVIAIALDQPRTTLLVRYDDRLQAHFVARSAVFGFPDLIALQVTPAGDAASLTLVSRSIYGRSDFGVNAARLRTWLAATRASAAKP